MHKPSADIARLTEGRAYEDQYVIRYRNIFEVAREERRKMYDKWDEAHKRSPAEINALVRGPLDWKPPMFQVEDADMTSFEDALRSWQDHSSQSNT
jgi:hypothetical protein